MISRKSLLANGLQLFRDGCFQLPSKIVFPRVRLAWRRSLSACGHGLTVINHLRTEFVSGSSLCGPGASCARSRTLAMIASKTERLLTTLQIEVRSIHQHSGKLFVLTTSPRSRASMNSGKLGSISFALQISSLVIQCTSATSSGFAVGISFSGRCAIHQAS